MLPDDVLLGMFDFYVDKDLYDVFKTRTENRGVENAGTRVSTLEKCRLSITTSPQSATPLYAPNPCEGHARHLAAFSSHHLRQRLQVQGRTIRCGQHHRRIRAQRSRLSNRSNLFVKITIAIRHGSSSA